MGGSAGSALFADAGRPGVAGMAGSTSVGGDAGASVAGSTAAGGTLNAAGSTSAVCDAGNVLFVHPGGLHQQSQLDRIKVGIASHTEPYASAWAAFHPPSSDSTAVAPTKIDATNPYALQDQGHVMYLLAVYWALSGDAAYGAAAAQMLNAWASTFTGPNAADATLRLGLGAIQMINAAELLRAANGGYAGFTEQDEFAFSAMLARAVYPTLHGAWTTNGDAGWGTPAVAALMAAAIFNDDCAWFNEAVAQFKRSPCVSVYQIVNDGRHGGPLYIGENAESGRDQGHVQGTVAHLAEAAEMAWSQGLDLYGEGNDLVLSGMDYNAKYNLGLEVPFTPMSTCTSSYSSISSAGRGSLSPVYEMVWNHYHQRRGRPATYIGQARATYAPEPSNGDHVGLGTLMYSRPLEVGLVP